MKKSIKRVLSMLLVAILVLGSIPMMSFAVDSKYFIESTQDSLTALPQSLSNGEIWAGKSVTYDADGVFDVTLKVTGQNYTLETPIPQEQYDVVLVLDRSGSMGGQKFKDMKTAAISTATEFLKVNGNKVSIISYNDNAQTNIGLSSNLNNIKKSINDLKVDKDYGDYTGGTNIQSAIYTAEKLLNARSVADKARKSVVILMSDGEPTYYYNSTTDHSNRIGEGNSTNKEYVWNTVLQAQQLKNNVSGVLIYTIGIGVGNNDYAKATLMPTESNTASIRPNQVQTRSYNGIITDIFERTWSLGWSNWKLIDTQLNPNTTPWVDFPHSVSLPERTISNKSYYGNYSYLVDHLMYEKRSRNATADITEYRYDTRLSTFNHKYWEDGSSITSTNTQDIVDAFTKISTQLTNHKPNVITDNETYSDVIVTDVLGDGFELVGTPSGFTFDSSTNKVTWTIPGSQFNTMDAGSTSLNPSIVHTLTFKVKLADGYVAQTYNTNKSANYQFSVKEANPFFTEIGLVTKQLSNSGSITIGTHQVTVTFDANGGTPTPTSQTIDQYDPATKPSTDPSKEGFDFDYWMLGGSEYDFNTPVTSDINLVAHYTAKVVDPTSFNVTFDANGGAPTPEDQSVEENSTATKPSTDPSKEGFDFDYWMLGENVYDFSTPVTSDINLVAHYTAKVVDPTSFNVTFDANGGAPTPGDQSVEENSTATKPSTDPSKEGFDFDYWMLGENVYDFSTPVTSDINLVAHYTAKVVDPTSFNVTFDANGGAPTPEDQSVEENSTATKPSTDPSKEGFDFDYWMLGENVYDFSTPVTSDINLVAHYTAKVVDPTSFNVTFDANGGAPTPDAQTVEENSTATKPSTDPSKEGFDFDYWMLGENVYDFSTPVTSDINLVAHYTAKVVDPTSFNVTFDANGGAPTPGDQTVEENSTATKPSTDPSKEGFDFDYWMLGENVYDFSTPVTSDINLVAHYTAKVVDPTNSTQEPTEPTNPTQAPTEPQGPQGSVVVNFVDTDGISIASSFNFTGSVGTLYQTSARTIDGYELVETPANASGSFIDGSITVDYVYSNGVTVAEEETPLGEAITPFNFDSFYDNMETTEAASDEAVILDEETPLADALPQTGQASPELFYGIGSIVSALGIYLKRKNR